MITTSAIRISKFCAGLNVPDPCPSSCLSFNEPRILFYWVKDICKYNTNARRWRDFTVVKERKWLSEWIYKRILPWDWSVQKFPRFIVPSSTGIEITEPLKSSHPYVTVQPHGPGTCAVSSSQKLGVFAALNIMSACLLPIFGRRTFINRVTFGLFGRLGSEAWPIVGPTCHPACIWQSHQCSRYSINSRIR
jgi:hypothetical protein